MHIEWGNFYEQLQIAIIMSYRNMGRDVRAERRCKLSLTVKIFCEEEFERFGSSLINSM